MPSYPIFLINLDGSTDRLATANAALVAEGVRASRIAAYDGRNVDPQQVPEYDNAAAMAYMGRPLNGGEVGCFFSHLRAAQAFLETGAPFGLVLEDDMQPDEAAFDTTEALINWQLARGIPDWHLANMGALRMSILSPCTTLAIQGLQTTVLRAHYFPMRSTALLWTRAGAQKFVDSALPMDCPLDHFNRRWMTASDMGLTLDPAPFSITGAQSEIDQSNVKKRGGAARSRSYQWRRSKRTFGDKLRALRHKLRYQVQFKEAQQ